jgi:glutaredoxin
MNNKFKIAFFLSIGLMLFSIFNYILIITGSTLCKSDGCSFAGTMISIDKQYLYLLGALFGSLMGYISYLISDQNKETEKLQELWNVLITGALIFESAIYLHLFITTGTVCAICTIIYALIISMFLTTRSIISFIPIVLSIFLALSLMQTTKVNFKVNSQYTLFQSETCPHCKKVKNYLNEHSIVYSKVNALDSEAYTFLQSLNISSIPVLLEKTNNGYRVIEGDNNIIKSFKDKTSSVEIKQITKEEPNLIQQKFSNETPMITKEKILEREIGRASINPKYIEENPLFNIKVNNEEGCQIQQQTPCVDENKTN